MTVLPDQARYARSLAISSLSGLATPASGTRTVPGVQARTSRASCFQRTMRKLYLEAVLVRRSKRSGSEMRSSSR